MNKKDILAFYRGRRVLVTGHSGFKGSWLCKMLSNAGAQVTGFSLGLPTDPALFEIAALDRDVHSIWGDIRDFDALQRAFEEAAPEIVIHMAAQPIVRESYRNPRQTYETNVMGTVNFLECARQCESVKSVLVVTTDKVYLNRERAEGYREDEMLDGYDPYSNSKSCAELAAHSYARSFFSGIPVSTARAGNVIGGGDFASDRILPDCVRAAAAGEPILVRNPKSIRPYQHVLDPLTAYLMIASRQMEDPALAGWYNVGPDDENCVTTGALTDLFVQKWGPGASWVRGDAAGPHEASFLKLDCTRLKETFGWKPCWSIETAVEKTVEWSKCWLGGGDVRACMDRQIESFLED